MKLKPDRKKLVRKVDLLLFCDDNTGMWGMTHKETCKLDGFNAFWDGRGIFHDVFEHAHELTDPNFRGQYAFNIGGEIAAMGSLWYFHSECNFYNRLISQHVQQDSPDEGTMKATLSMMEDIIRGEYTSFGHTLESCIENQPESDNDGLEWIIQKHFDTVQTFAYKGGHKDEMEASEEYKKTVTLEKLQNLYRYGYNMAKKLYSDSLHENGDVFDSFMGYWAEFCEKNEAEATSKMFRGITFFLYRTGNGLCSWKAELIPHCRSEEKNVIRSETAYKGNIRCLAD